MDIIENGINAQATLIHLSVVENRKENRLYVTIRDNGQGLSKEKLQEVMDPFYTTRTTRRVGLGLSLFQETSRRCEGTFDIKSKEGEGTEVFSSFQLDHIDLPPLGDMAGSMSSLIVGNPEVDFVYTHEVEGDTFDLDTREVRSELDEVPITHPEVIKYLTETMRESLKEIGAGSFVASVKSVK